MRKIERYIRRISAAILLGVSCYVPCQGMRRGVACFNKLPALQLRNPSSVQANFSTVARPRRMDIPRGRLANNPWRPSHKPAEKPPVLSQQAPFENQLVREGAVNRWGTYFRNLNQIVQAVFLWPAAAGTALFGYFKPQVLKQKISDFLNNKKNEEPVKPNSSADIEVDVE